MDPGYHVHKFWCFFLCPRLWFMDSWHKHLHGSTTEFQTHFFGNGYLWTPKKIHGKMKVFNPQIYTYIYILMVITPKNEGFTWVPMVLGGWDPRTWIAPWFGWITSPFRWSGLVESCSFRCAEPGDSRWWTGLCGIQGSLKMNKHVEWDQKLGGCFKYFSFSSILAEDSHFDEYFSKGLKPPTRKLWTVDGKGRRSPICSFPFLGQFG